MIRGSLIVDNGVKEYKCSIIGVQNQANIRLDFDASSGGAIFQDLNIPDYFQAFVNDMDYTNMSGETVQVFPTEITKKSSSIRLYKSKEHIWHYMAWIVKYALYCAEQTKYIEESIRLGDVYHVCEDEVFEKRNNHGVLFTDVDIRFIQNKGNVLSFEATYTIGNVEFTLSFTDDTDFKCQLQRVAKFGKTVQVIDPFNTHITDKQFQSLLTMGVSKVESLLVDLDALVASKRMGGIFEEDSVFIETTEQFFEFLDSLEAHKTLEPHKLLGLDFETTGLRLHSISRDRHPASDRPVGIVMGFKGEERVYYLSMYHTSIGNCLTEGYEPYMGRIKSAIDALPVDQRYKDRALGNIPENNDWAIMALLKPYLEFFNMVNANVGFDWRCGWIYGVNINYVGDTQVAGHLNRYKYGSNPGLKSLTKAVLNKSVIELDDLSPTGNWSDLPLSFRDLPRRYIKAYAFNDIRNLFPILEETERLVDKTQQRYVYELEVLLQRCIGYQEFWGYDMDLEQIEKTIESVTKQKDEARKQMLTLAGRDFNPESPKQLLDVLNELGHEVTSTNKESRALLPDDDPFCKALNTYKNVSQTLKLFLEPLGDQLIDSTIYPSTMAMGADTGRMSSSKPNYQQADDTIRKLIVPRKGFKYSDTDLAQIEYRVNASVAKEPSLLEMFKDPWKDFHTYQTGIIYDMPYETVPKPLRKRTKAVNFGLIFGMGDGLMGYHVFGKRTKDTRAQAHDIKSKIFAKQRNVERFFNRTISYAQETGYTKTIYGRRRFFDIARKGKDSVVTVASNAVIQGSACDIFKLGCVAYFLNLVKYKLLDKVRFIAFVHDELLDEFSVELNPYFILKLKRECFEQDFKDMCPVYSGCGIGDSWYNAKSDDSEINTVLGHQLYKKADTVYWKDSKYYVDMDFTELMAKELAEFRLNLIKEYLTNPDNANKTIKPHVYSYLVEYFTPSICEYNGKIRDCARARVDSCPNDGDFTNCPVCWKLKEHIEYFVDTFASDIKGDIVANIGDPADLEQSTASNKLGKEIDDSASFSATADDYLMITGYFLRDNELLINLATLPQKYLAPLQSYLLENTGYIDGDEISIPKDNRLMVKLVFVNNETATDVTGFIVHDKCEMNLIKFMNDAVVPITV